MLSSKSSLLKTKVGQTVQRCFVISFASNALTPTLTCRRFGHRLKAYCVVRSVALGNKLYAKGATVVAAFLLDPI